jgi:hypothetical protein
MGRLFRFEQQHGDGDAVANAGDGCTEEDVGEQAVSVGAHGDEIAAFLLDPFDDLAGGFAEGEFGLGGNSGRFEFGADFLEICGVFGDLGADGVGAVGAGGPAVGDVKQNQTAMRQLGELLGVLDDGAVAGRAVQSDCNFVVTFP